MSYQFVILFFNNLKKCRDYVCASPPAVVVAGAGFGGLTYVIVTISTDFFVTGAVYWVSITRHFTGQVSTQELQTIHRNRSICHVFASLFNRIACEGHFRWHIPQEMHRLASTITCPREIGVFFAGWNGYRMVGGQ